MAGGRPRIEFTEDKFDSWDMLDAMILWGTQEYCAEQLNVSVESLATRIKERYAMSFPEYKHKRLESVRVSLARKQYDVAMKGNVTMLIWLGKNMLGQSDKAEVKANNKIEVTITNEDAQL